MPDLCAIIDWTARLGAVTAEALAARDGCALASARGHLLGARQAGLIHCWRPLHRRPPLFTVTREGLRAFGLTGLDPGRVSAAGAQHAIVCAAAAVELERRYPDRVVSGVPELRRRERAAGHALASATVRDTEDWVTLLHRPDLVLWAAPASPFRPIAVEVELTVKAPLRLAALCRAWARCAWIEGVVYLAAPEVIGPLSRAIERAQAQRRIVLVALEQVTGESSSGAPAGRPAPIGQAVTSAA
jgi:hypothetical protein